MTQHIHVIVKRRYNGLRLDQFLVEARFPWPTEKPGRKELQSLIQRGDIEVDGETVRPSYRVKPNETISLSRTPQSLAVKREAITHIPVIFEDEVVLVINKPAGLSMHPVRAGQVGTLTDWIVEKHPMMNSVGEDPLRPGIVHRLDKDTSGLVVLAKTQTAFLALKKLFQARKIGKTYTVLIYGHLKEKEGSIKTPLGRVSGGIRRGTPLRKRSFAGEVRPAETEYSLRTAYPQHDLLSIKPKTGRTHQIRVHLAGIGHPVVGDRLYRFKVHRKDQLDPPHQLLHASALTFELFGTKYAFTAPLPEYFEQSLRTLDGK